MGVAARTTVLIADPSHEFTDACRAVLERGGDVEIVGAASDGRVALDYVHALDPDVVVASIALPLVDPFELARRLRYDGSDAAVVVVSGRGERPVRHLRDAAGVAGFISRDAPPEEFRAMFYALTSMVGAGVPLAAG